jgi:hypothetical protein
MAGCATIVSGSESYVGSTCDTFSLDNYKIIVKFYDPKVLVNEKYPNLDFKSPITTDKEKISKWIECLQSSPIYMFTVVDEIGNVKKHYCMRGNPEIKNSARFFQVAVVSADASAAFNPNGKDYSQFVERTVNDFPTSGQLFEHMTMFDDPSMKKYIGGGVLFFGVYVRIMPYDEVKKGMIKIIKDELGG